MGWFKKLFGSGKIRVECKTTAGESFVVKIPYEGDYDTLGESELFQQVKNQVFVDTGKVLIDMKIVGHYEN